MITKYLYTSAVVIWKVGKTLHEVHRNVSSYSGTNQASPDNDLIGND